LKNLKYSGESFAASPVKEKNKTPWRQSTARAKQFEKKDQNPIFPPPVARLFNLNQMNFNINLVDCQKMGFWDFT